MLTTHVAAVGVFQDLSAAQQAVKALRAAGFLEEQIGVIARSTSVDGESEFSHTSTAVKAGEGAIGGAVAGASMGGLWAIAVAANLLPAIGPVIAGGMLASVLASAATGAAAGGVLGALVGLGVPEEDAEFYHTEFQEGRVLVTVRSEERAHEANEILRSFGASRAGTSDPAAGTSRSDLTASTPRDADLAAISGAGSTIRGTDPSRERELPDSRQVEGNGHLDPLGRNSTPKPR